MLPVMLSSSLHCTECLIGYSAYLNPLYNPALQGNWPHLLMYDLHALTLKIATYVEMAVSSILRSYHYVYEIHLVSNNIR